MTDKAYELFNKILSGEGDWDYSDLEALLSITRREGYDEGYKKAKAEQPVIKPLEFYDEVAHTSVATYDVYRDDEDHMIHVDIDNCHEGVFDYRKDAIQYCKEHYENLIKQCLKTEQENETES